MEKNDALKAQSENGDALGGLSTEKLKGWKITTFWRQNV